MKTESFFQSNRAVTTTANPDRIFANSSGEPNKSFAIFGYIARVFRDEGQSAKTTGRPQLQAMLKYCAAEGKRLGITAIVVYRVDRLARVFVDHTSIRRCLRKARRGGAVRDRSLRRLARRKVHRERDGLCRTTRQRRPVGANHRRNARGSAARPMDVASTPRVQERRPFTIGIYVFDGEDDRPLRAPEKLSGEAPQRFHERKVSIA